MTSDAVVLVFANILDAASVDEVAHRRLDELGERRRHRLGAGNTAVGLQLVVGRVTREAAVVVRPREEVDGVLDTIAGVTEAPDDTVNRAALVARAVLSVVV